MSAGARYAIVPVVVVLSMLSGCALLEGYRHCADVDPIASAQLPTHLSETGLFSNVRGDVVTPGVLAYRPTFELWSDGATKRRWIWLPPGARIDTGNVDSWSFPVGTKLWKEFTRDGVRVETRLLQRIGAGMADWAAVAYLWNDSGSDAVAVPDGVEDARGTSHDVPAASECVGCHGGRRSRVLGFSALQLSHPADAGMVGLDELAGRGLLTAPPSGPLELHASPTETAALGYLHANCSHCHNQDRPASAGGLRCFNPEKEFDFYLRASDLGAVEQTATYRTAVGSVIKRGDPDGSTVIERISTRDRFPPSMPPLATERVDDHAVDMIRAWIRGL